ncbi:MAG: nucleotidyltransferase family protein [Ruminiclostridium sp.]|nr:nucleotidyltransferase family protein [Ruminiclostridium sp.]
MTDEQTMKTARDLIYLVGCAVNKETPDTGRVADMDPDALYKMASRHLIAATAAPALKAAGVRNDLFENALNNSILKNITMDAEMDALFAALDKAGIWHMPLKGIVLQHIYPHYGMRQMADHDILFDAGRADEVKSIMEGLGFHTEHFGAGNHDVYHKKPVSNFEMHRSLFDEAHDEKIYEYYKNVYERLLGDGLEKHFSPEDFYIYATAHEHKHYSGGGTGLRSLIDTYVYLKNTTLDMSYIAAETEKLGIADFEVENRTLAQHIFSGGELTEAEQQMLDYILSSGTYGTISHHVENNIRKSKHGKLGYALGRFFVPVSKKNKRYAGFAGSYPFFYKHKILLPLLPFYRTFRAMKNGKFRSEAKAIKNAKV